MKLQIILTIWVIALIGAIGGKYALSESEHKKAFWLFLEPRSNDWRGWSKASITAVNQLTAKYGSPVKKTASMAIWYNNGPWKRTIVYAQGHHHDFPVSHLDIVHQFLEYPVSPEWINEVEAFNSSIVFHSSGEISVRCDREETNYLVLNLANEIIKGKITALSAKEIQETIISDLSEGISHNYLQQLTFSTPLETALLQRQNRQLHYLAEEGN